MHHGRPVLLESRDGQLLGLIPGEQVPVIKKSKLEQGTVIKTNGVRYGKDIKVDLLTEVPVLEACSLKANIQCDLMNTKCIIYLGHTDN